MEGALLALLTIALATGVAVYSSRLMAIVKHRAPSVWMWAVALFPPTLLVLALMPGRGPRFAGVRS